MISNCSHPLFSLPHGTDERLGSISRFSREHHRNETVRFDIRMADHVTIIPILAILPPERKTETDGERKRESGG